MKNQKNGKMAYILQAISIIPLFFFGVIILALATDLFTKAMYREISVELAGAAKSISYMLDASYPGDYTLESDSSSPSLYLFKGDTDLTTNFDLVDNIKSNTGFDITLFYQDTSILTTLLDENGQRMIGRSTAKLVLEKVLYQGEAQFYTRTKFGNCEFFCYYLPLLNSDDSVVGMLLVAKPSDRVNQAIRSASYPLFFAVIAVAFIIGVFIHLYTRKFDGVLQKIRLFLSSISTGDLGARLDDSVLKRHDEFGDIGRSAIQMQQSLRITIEQDALTELYNRRSGDRRLQQIIQKAAVKQSPFCVCIGDIDFFKRVNDTYGHDCGDFVLKTVSAILKEHMNTCGFVARWGGEEFLLVFDKSNLAEAKRSLERLLKKIRETEITYHDQTLHVTMTFGVTEGTCSDPDVLLKAADDLLYEGKTGGRDRIIS